MSDALKLGGVLAATVAAGAAATLAGRRRNPSGSNTPAPSSAGGPSSLQELQAELLRELDAPADPSPVPTTFLVGWGTLCTCALGAGSVLGYRSFFRSVAHEALDKLEKPTAESEARAYSMAVRAFGWGTALAFGCTAVGVLAASQLLDLRTGSDVHEAARSGLRPVDDWLQRHASSAVTVLGDEPRRRLSSTAEWLGGMWRSVTPTADLARGATQDAGSELPEQTTRDGRGL